MPVGPQKPRRLPSANVALGTAVIFVAASALLSFAPDRTMGSGQASRQVPLRGALDAGAPLQAPVKPV